MKLPSSVGVIHLPPLPGSPGAAHLEPSKVMNQICEHAVAEAKLLEKSGFDGVVLENFGDAPFYKTRVNPETIASMAVIGKAVRDSIKVSLGINVLRNDAEAALAIASVIGADFIRVNVLAGLVATDQGLIEGNAAYLIRERLRLGSKKIGILADVHVKHAKTLSSDDLAIAIEEVAGRGGADGVIVTGSTTGRAPDVDTLATAMAAAKHCGVPLYVGSGMTPEGLQSMSVKGLRMIVGSTLRTGGKAGAKLDSLRMKRYMKAWLSYSSVIK